jgi:hypothetical protein
MVETELQIFDTTQIGEKEEGEFKGEGKVRGVQNSL